MVSATVMEPVTPPRSLRLNVAGTVTPVRSWALLIVEGMFCVPVVNDPDAGVRVGAGVDPGDADAGGTPIAVTSTGTDHATPLTIRRRLTPLFSLLMTSEFRTSDNVPPM